ncbi:MAG: lysophospholipid acyltransferase family protein [Chitinispirillaceae bacterium]|jgi:hypothetical protein|nr:lysophospholipid acyltransferase family protein [Chitinispirillaceae bacterium]
MSRPAYLSCAGVRRNYFFSAMHEDFTRRIPVDTTSALILLTGSLLCRTWQYRISGRTDLLPSRDLKRGIVFCLWHAGLLAISFHLRNTGLFWLISQSKDGRRAAAVLQRWRHGIIQGSSSRGGMQAVRNSLRTLKSGNSIAITPDGPRGPREIVKPGAAQIALLANAPIVPLIVKSENCWQLRSWDRFLIPKPFAEIRIVVGEPLDPASFSAAADPNAAMVAAVQEALCA